MVDHVSHEYRQVARNLGVKPEVILAAIKQGLLPATKVSKNNILVADQDLIIFLKRYSDYKAANESLENTAWREAEELVEPAKSFLARRERMEREARKRYAEEGPRQIRESHPVVKYQTHNWSVRGRNLKKDQEWS